METIKVSKRKVITAVTAIAMAAAIMQSGTFAWQSINQEALNEVFSAVNPGGRLHDDFVDLTFGSDGIADYETMTFNKDVYVENFTSLARNGVQIFARVRLDEYMELGVNAGALNGEGKKAEDNHAVSIVDGAKLDDMTTWETHIPGNDDDPFHDYWDWAIGGQTKYMPTFNKNNASLEADINGTFRSNFDDYKDHNKLTEITEDDELSKTIDATYYDKAEGKTYTLKETHTVKDTINGGVITMQKWIDEGMPVGNFWVWDTDGWAYWANPINPDTATGLLLDGISRTHEIINEDWYYGINVVAQFITGDDIGYGKGTGFYDLEAGVAPSDDALLLLNKIGVEVTFEVSSAEELQEALTHGGNVILKNNITVDTNLVVSADTTLNLGNYTISNTDEIYDEESKVWSLISVQGADTTLTINSGNFIAKEDDCFAVDVRDGARVIINGGFFDGNISAVYVHTGSALINGGTFAIQQPNTTSNEGAHDQMINAYDESYTNGTAEITVCGGTFYGFNPTAANDGNFVPDGYSVSNTDSVYKVSETVTE